MDKKYVNFIVITVLFLAGYSLFIAKFYPPQQSPVSVTPLKNQGNVPHQIKEPLVKERLPSPIKELTRDVETDNFIVTYSLTGGYVKKIYVKAYREKLIFSNIGYIPETRNQQFNLSSPQRNTVILTNRDNSIRKTWKFKGYHVVLTIVNTHSPLLMNLFYSPLSSNSLDQRYQEIFYQQSASSAITRISPKKIKIRDDIPTKLVGARDRYFCVVFFNSKHSVTLEQKDKKVIASVSINHPKTNWDFYVGPQLRKELLKYKLERIISYGFFNSIGVIILKILYILEHITHSWGVSLILLSVIIYLILFPFTMKSTQAMKKMQEIQPLIQEIQKKYKDNPQKIQKEQVQLFKKHKVNPFGSCLPMFFQFPVFIALYQVLFRFIELKGARFLWIKDLSLPDHTFKLPFSLPYVGDYFNILPLFIIIISYLQQRVTTSGANAQQQSTAMIFMVFIGVIFYHFPSCLVMYWFVQNILTVLYQYRVHRLAEPLT